LVQQLLPHRNWPPQHWLSATQAPPPQDLVPAGQTHERLLQTCWVPQPLLQPPQLLRSLVTFWQCPLHQASPPAQQSFRLKTQVAGLLGQAWRPPGQPQFRPLHTRSPVQRLLQEPQLSRLLLKFVQVPLQAPFGAMQRQTRVMHTSAP
jgi:hypothetical protein